MNWTIDFFFLLELITNFSSAYPDENKDMCDDRKRIAIRYFKGWFFIDFVSILPLDIILLAFVE
jgi:hypothetical protein